MNRAYKENYIKQSISDDELNRVLKFHQSSVEVISQPLIEDAWVKENGDAITKSESCIEKIFIDGADSHIASLFARLKEGFSTLATITTFPVLTVFSSKEKNISQGSYTFDFETQCLMKYKELNDKALSNLYENTSLCISLFLDIEKSLYINRKSAYMLGVLQVGMLSQKVYEHSSAHNIPIADLFFNTQSFANAIGINLRKQLLINNIFFGGEL